jgi:hypothetical protein
MLSFAASISYPADEATLCAYTLAQQGEAQVQKLFSGKILPLRELGFWKSWSRNIFHLLGDLAYRV